MQKRQNNISKKDAKKKQKKAGVYIILYVECYESAIDAGCCQMLWFCTIIFDTFMANVLVLNVLKISSISITKKNYWKETYAKNII